MSAAPDEVVHQSMRLKIMAALESEPADAELDFVRLKRIVGATDGNLGAHLATLEKAGYIAIAKTPEGKRVRTTVRLTRAGRAAFLRHIAYLREIVAGVSG